MYGDHLFLDNQDFQTTPVSAILFFLQSIKHIANLYDSMPPITYLINGLGPPLLRIPHILNSAKQHKEVEILFEELLQSIISFQKFVFSLSGPYEEQCGPRVNKSSFETLIFPLS